MITEWFSFIDSFLASYSAPALFALGFIEEVIFIIPSTLAFIGSGFFLISPDATAREAFIYSFGRIAFPITLGVVVGSFVIYRIVYWGGKPFILRFGRYVGIRWQDIERLHRRFETGHLDEAALIALRITPVFPISIVTVLCGIFRVGWWEFIWTTFLGVTPRIMGLALLGWQVGKEYAKYAEYITMLNQYIFAAIGFVAMAAFIRWRWRRVIQPQAE